MSDSPPRPPAGVSERCERVRRRLAGGEALDDREREHIAACEVCAAAARRQARETARLRRALEVPVPEDLSAGILMTQSFAERRRRRSRTGVLAALAAGVALFVITLGLPQFQAHRTGQTLLGIIASASYALEPTAPLDDATVSDGLAAAGIGFDVARHSVSFAGPCLVGGIVAGHVVLREPEGPVTVLMIPGESLSEPITFEDRRWRGVAIPGEDGLLALIGPQDADTDALFERVRSSLRWQRLPTVSSGPGA